MLLGVWGALEKISCFLGAAGRGVNRKSKSIGTAARVRSAIKRLQRKTSCRSSRALLLSCQPVVKRRSRLCHKHPGKTAEWT